MAEDKDRQRGDQPPKIMLNGEATEADESASQTPPRITIPPSASKKETARIDLAAAVPPARKTPFTPPKTVSQPKTSAAKSDDEEKKRTVAVRLSADAIRKADAMETAEGMTPVAEGDIEEAAKKSTIRIKLSDEQVKAAAAKAEEGSDLIPMPAEDIEEASKKSTIKVKLTDDQIREAIGKMDGGAQDMRPMSPEEAEQAKKSTVRVKLTEDQIKKATSKMETAAGMSPVSEEDRVEATKKSTVRVQIEEEKAKGDTARLDTSALNDQEAKKKTSRIELNEVLDSDDDIFKRRTALLDASKFAGVTDAPGAPRTIRIKRAPDVPPTTVLRPEAPAATQAEKSETRKSETARIDLPPEAVEQPPTRRKTIRIKRPEGVVTSKPLVLSKPTTRPQDIEEISPSQPAAEQSPVVSLIALIAVLVAAALVVVQGMSLSSLAQF